MIDFIARLVQHAPRQLIGLLLVATIAIGVGTKEIRILDDLTQVIPPSSPVRQAMTQLENTFGPSETLVVMARNPGGTIFDQTFLTHLHAFSAALDSQRPLNRVQGLTTLSVFERGADGSLQPRPLLKDAPQSASAVARIKSDVTSDSDIQRAFVSLDGQSTALYVDPKKGFVDSEILDAIDDAAKALGPYDLHITGMPVVRLATTQAIRSDMKVMIPFVVLILVGFLGWTFRTISGVVLTILIVGLSILPGAGLMGRLGIPMTAINNTFPVLILAIACAGAIHFLSIYYLRIREGIEKDEAVRLVIKELAVPILIAAVTTAAGFLSLMLSPIPPIGTLGWVVALGVMWAWLLTSVGLPAVLTLLPAPKLPPAHEARGESFFRMLAGLSQRSPAGVLLVVAAALAFVAGVGMPLLERETRVERFFTTDSRARADSEVIDVAFRGSTPLELIIEEDVKSSSVMQQVATFSEAVQKLPEVGSVDSIVNVVARIQEGFAGERTIPDDDFQIARSRYSFTACRRRRHNTSALSPPTKNRFV